MFESKSLRVAYGEALAELGSIDQKVVVLDADLSHATMTSIFASKFPDRFFNFGHGICTTHTESLPFFGRTVSIVVFTAVFLRAAAAHKKHKRSCAHPEDSYIHKSSSVVFIQSGTVIVAVQRNFDAPLC